MTALCLSVVLCVSLCNKKEELSQSSTEGSQSSTEIKKEKSQIS